MDELLGDLTHKTDSLTEGQMALRALLIFVLTIVYVRIAGRRSVGMRTPFDTVISLLLGATLSRAIVGASSFTGTVVASLVLVVLHRLFAWLSAHNQTFSRLVGGSKRVLYEAGQLNHDNMNAMLVSQSDLQEAARRMGNVDSLDDVQTAIIERSGEISIVTKPRTELPTKPSVMR